MRKATGRKLKKRRWLVTRLASRGRSWGAARRNFVVKARTLGRAIAKALNKVDVDLKHGTGVSLAIELQAAKAVDRSRGNAPPMRPHQPTMAVTAPTNEEAIEK